MRLASHTYSIMVNSINELKYLRSLDSGEKLDPRDKIKATAGRVGLSVPKVYYFYYYCRLYNDYYYYYYTNIFFILIILYC